MSPVRALPIRLQPRLKVQETSQQIPSEEASARRTDVYRSRRLVAEVCDLHRVPRTTQGDESIFYRLDSSLFSPKLASSGAARFKSILRHFAAATMIPARVAWRTATTALGATFR